LATGEQGSATQYQEFNWKFAPQVYPEETSNCKNLGGIKFDFANPIDTLKKWNKETVLYNHLNILKKVGTPVEVNLNSVAEETSPNHYINTGAMPMAVLLEGNFKSMYENRVLAFEQTKFKTKGVANKMIVISDGDLIKNQVNKDFEPVELGYDQRSGNFMTTKIFY
jgi:gliding-associated putative ABC transporter substrate-binding component GldG